jgi:GNAT superfamily N-acetyltransferase
MPSKKQRAKMNAKCKGAGEKKNAPPHRESKKKEKKDPMRDMMIRLAHTTPQVQNDPILQKIAKMVCDYNWIYRGEVCSEVLMSPFPTHSEGDGGFIEKKFKMINEPQEDCGFHITYIYPRRRIAEVMYIFIIPECRRKGIATAYLESLKEDYSKVIVNTAETPMKECVKKLGFEFDRMCDNGRELSYEFNNS